MKKFVLSPNLPENANAVLLGEKYYGLLGETLRKIHISPVKVPNNPFVDKRLSGHADLSVCHGGGVRFFLAKHLENSSLHSFLAAAGADCVFSEEVQGEIYPADCGLNVCAFAEKLVYSPAAAESLLQRFFLEENSYIGIPVKQGYSKCITCVVDDNSAICADKGVSAALRKHGVDVLEICPSYINLEGFPYGFIGGASFKISSDKIAFTGKLDGHPDKERIISFLESKEIEPVFLTDYDIFDIGSVIPVFEH